MDNKAEPATKSASTECHVTTIMSLYPKILTSDELRSPPTQTEDDLISVDSEDRASIRVDTLPTRPCDDDNDGSSGFRTEGEVNGGKNKDTEDQEESSPPSTPESFHEGKLSRN